MKIQDIQAGKKYWKTKTTKSSRSIRKEVVSFPVYVIQVDLAKLQVLCSINGGPAQFVSKAQFSKWKQEDPIKK